METKPDLVNHPPHYKRENFELIDVLEAFDLDKHGHLMQAAQYIFRAPHKGQMLEDLQKARWYLDRAIWWYKVEHPDETMATSNTPSHRL